MPLAQDRFRPKPHKISESQLYLKKGKSIHLCADPEDLWAVKSICDGEKSLSGNNSDADTDENVTCQNSHFKCLEGRHYGEQELRKQKSVRFDSGRYSSGESADNDCFEEREERRRCGDDAKHVHDGEEQCYHVCDSQEERSCCAKYKSKVRALGHGYVKNEKARRSPKDDFGSGLRRASPKEKLHGKGCSEHVATRVRPTYGRDCDEEVHRCGDWCKWYQADEPRPQKVPVEMLARSKPYKHVHHVKKDKATDMNYKDEGIYRPKTEHCYHAKKILDSYEELPAVDEAMEQRSDATYKASYTNFTKQGDSKTTFTHEKNNKVKEAYERSPSWILCDKMAERALKDAQPYEMYQERTIKTRSRRTRMNRIRDTKWMKALIHPVLEGSRKEMVGVMLWGQSGPEYYSKMTNSKGCIPFRKTRSFPEDTAKSYDMPFTFKPKNLSSASDPGRKHRCEPRSQENDNKLEEKIAKFDKNLEELEKTTQEKLIQPFAEESKDKNDGNKDESKEHVIQLMPYELLSSRVPMRKMDKCGRDMFAFNVESKTTAENLNERAKQFKLNPVAHQNDKLSELKMKFPPLILDKDKIDANLALWGMKRNEDEIKELLDAQKIGGEGDGKDRLNLRIPLRKEGGDPKPCEIHSMTETEEKGITDAAMEKLSDEMHRERRKKYSEAAAAAAAALNEEKNDGKDGAVKDQSPESEKGSGDKILLEHIDLFNNLVKDGCAISEKESKNLQRIMNKMRYEGNDGTTSEDNSKTSCETIKDLRESSRCSKYEKNESEKKSGETNEGSRWTKEEKDDRVLSDGASKKHTRKKDDDSYRKTWKKHSKRDSKNRKKALNAEKMRMIREALPSMAAKNDATHLKQLKSYIHRFIDELENKISFPGEARGRRHGRKSKDTTSSDSSEVSVDARKLIDLVSDPFKRITSDMTIDMAKKLTDALVQEKSPKNFTSSSKTRKNSDGTEDASIPCPTTSGSDQDDEVELTYLEGLKKMRHDHLSNIIKEVKRLRQLLRFLDRYSRLKL